MRISRINQIEFAFPLNNSYQFAGLRTSNFMLKTQFEKFYKTIFFLQNMPVEIGDTVKVTYEGRLDNGEIFDTSQHGEHNHPIEFTIGNHEVIKGFEDAVLGMEIEDEKNFSIQPKDAYGENREELVREFPRNEVPLQNEPKEGMFLSLRTPDGKEFSAKITKVTPEEITLDFNHPLAGKRLNFKIKMVDVSNNKKKEKEEEVEE